MLTQTQVPRARDTVLEDTIMFHTIKLPGIVSFTAAAFGKLFNGEQVNWSLTPLQQKDDALTHMELARRIETVLTNISVTKAYAPRPGFNAEFASREQLTTEIPLSKNGKSIYRNGEIPVDVSDIGISQAGLFSVGRCPVVVATDGKQFLFAHAGRECLIDRQLIAEGSRGREHESVVDTIMLRLWCNPKVVRVWVFGGVTGKELPHPLKGKHGKFNTAMLSYLLTKYGAMNVVRALIVENGNILLDLPQLIRAQFLNWGVPNDHIDVEFAYFSKEDAYTDDRPGQPRNLMVLARKF